MQGTCVPVDTWDKAIVLLGAKVLGDNSLSATR